MTAITPVRPTIARAAIAAFFTFPAATNAQHWCDEDCAYCRGPETD